MGRVISECGLPHIQLFPPRRRARGSGAPLVLLALLLLLPGRASADFLIHTYDPNSQIFSVNVDTGASTLIGSAGVQLTDLALSGDGRLFGSSLTGLYSVNSSTGAATLIGSFGTTTSMVGLDAGPEGQLFGVGQSGGGFFAIDPTTGSATLLFSTPFSYTGDVAYFRDNDFYATASFGDGSHLVEINAATSSAVDHGLIASGQLSPGLDFDLTGRLIAFSVSGNAYAIPNFNSSGSGVLLSDSGIAIAGATTLPATPSAVPEPATLGLFALGALGALWGSRKRRGATQEATSGE